MELVRQPVHRALTRPQMFAGVTYNFFIINAAVTTELFLERLGLSSLNDLPPIAPLLPEVDTIDDI